MARRDRNTPDMFDDWLAAQPVPAVLPAPSAEQENLPSDAPSETGRGELINFRERRRTLPRFILNPDSLDRGVMRMMAREEGVLAPAPILPLTRRPPPADPGDDDAPQRRAG